MIDSLAHHEAGHVVTAHRVGAILSSATIEPDSEASGHVRYYLFGLDVVKQAAIKLGGTIAQCLAHNWTPQVLSTARDDMRDVYRLIDDYRGDRVARPHNDEIYLAGWDLALHELTTNWPTVERVAQALLQRKRLDRKELYQLV